MKYKVIGASVFLIIIAFVCMIAGFGNYRNANNLAQSCTRTASGSITNVYEYHRRGKAHFDIDYIFYANAQRYSGTSTLTDAHIQKGDACIVHYNPDNISENYVGDVPYRNQSLNRVLMIFGAVFLVLGILSGLGGLKMKGVEQNESKGCQ